MSVRASLWVVFLLVFSNGTFGQDLDTLNQTIDGKKQGYWKIYGKDRPDKGYPSDGLIEEGPYKDNRKNGVWKKYRPDGSLKLSGTFVNNRPHGPYVRYDQHGDTLEVGDFNHTSKPTLPQTGSWDKPGLKEVISFTSDGAVQKIDSMLFEKHIIATYFEPLKRLAVNIFKVEGEKLVPHKSIRMKGHGISFSKNGKNVLLDEDGDVWLDGEFHEGRFMTGKVYVYSSVVKRILYVEHFDNGKSIKKVMF